MAISKVGSTVTYDLAADGSADDISLPVGLAESDIVLVWLGCDNPDSADLDKINTAGYANVHEEFVSTTGGIRCDRKFMGATPDSVVNISPCGSDSNNGKRAAIMIEAYRGVDLTTPIDAAPTEANGASGMPDGPSYTTVTNGALRLLGAHLDDDQVTATVPSGWDDVQSIAVGSSGAGSTTMKASLAAPTAGALNPAAFGGGGDDEWAIGHFALRPAGAAGLGIPIAAYHYNHHLGSMAS